VSNAELELQLRALAADIDFPEAPALAPAVRARLGRPRRRRRLVLALAVVAVAVAGIVAVPSARTTVERWLGFGEVRIRFVDRLPRRPVSPNAQLGEAVSVGEARRHVPFGIVVPPRSLGEPAVYVQQYLAGGIVSFVYGTKERARLIISEVGGDYRPYIQKTIAAASRSVTETKVNGRQALWIEGAHYVEFADSGGAFTSVPAQLAGRVLLWERDGVTYRIEGELTLDQARKVAESLG
jgi:hypothetical protein